MWSHRSFIAPLKADIKASFFSAYGKDITIPDAKLSDFIQASGFNTLMDATTHFRRVIQYYREKYTYIPSFNHLISSKIPILRNTAEWEQAVARRFPQFRPYLFTPAKTALSTDYAAFDSMLCSEESVQVALDLADCIKLSYNLRYVPSAVILLERVVFTMSYRGVKSDLPFIPVMQAHKRLACMRKPGRDSSKVWRDLHPGYAVVRRIMFKVGGKYHHWWNALKIIINDGLWKEVDGNADIDREALLRSWLADTVRMGKSAKVLVADHPLSLSYSEVQALFRLPEFSDVMAYYPYGTEV